MHTKTTRKQQAEKILAAPQYYKICYGCDSIAKKETSVCPVCKNYNFDSQEDVVKQQAIVLSEKPQTIITDYE